MTNDINVFSFLYSTFFTSQCASLTITPSVRNLTNPCLGLPLISILHVNITLFVSPNPLMQQTRRIRKFHSRHLCSRTVNMVVCIGWQFVPDHEVWTRNQTSHWLPCVCSYISMADMTKDISKARRLKDFQISTKTCYPFEWNPRRNSVPLSYIITSYREVNHIPAFVLKDHQVKSSKMDLLSLSQTESGYLTSQWLSMKKTLLIFVIR